MLRPKTAASRLSLRQRGGASDEQDDNDAQAKKVELGFLIFRIVIVLAMLSVSLSYVVSDVLKYLKRDTITSVSVDLLPNVTFPAVTLCNYNRWKHSLISEEDMSVLADMMQAQQESNIPPDTSDSSGGSSTDATRSNGDFTMTDGAFTMTGGTITMGGGTNNAITDGSLTETMGMISVTGTYESISSTVASSTAVTSTAVSSTAVSSTAVSSTAVSSTAVSSTAVPSTVTSHATSSVRSTTATNSTATNQSSTTTRPPASSFNLYDFTRYSGWKLTDPAKVNSSMTVNGTLLSCTFRGVDCDTNFFTPITTAYGSCYTFNKDIKWTNVSARAKKRLKKPLIQTVAREDTGLSLEIDIEAWDYYENVDVDGNYQSGLKVIVHSPDRLPDPSSEGIPISPGQHATIPVTWSEYNYMEPPWGDCNTSATLQYFDKYTQEGCMWECIKTTVLSTCSCVIYYQANDTDIVCDLKQSKACAFTLIGDIVNDPDTYCTCQVACTSEAYDSTAYYATAPSDSMAPGLAAQYGMSPSYYRTNVVSLDIYMSQMIRTTVTQVEAMSLDQVIANAGGQLGLFAGFSFMTFLELIEFLYERWASKREERKEKQNKVEPFVAK